MIRVIIKNLNKKKLSEHKWDWHFAFFHFKNYKNAYLNGKPLKPWHILKNGDVIEIIERPQGLILGALWALGGWLLTTVGVTSASVAGVYAAGALVAGVIGAAVTAVGFGIASMFSSSAGGGAGTTQAKEYSSSTQPELRGASNDISNDCLPVVFGTIQQTPSYAQLPYRLVVDGASTNKYRQYFIANYNNVVYSNFKLGETSRTDYSIDYIDILTASGSSNFIGFDNVKAHDINEELSYNPDEAVNQNAHFDYNQATNTNYVTVSYQLKFTNVDLNSWTNKTFRQSTLVVQGGTNSNKTSDITITSAMLSATDVEGEYIYNGSATYNTGYNDEGDPNPNFTEIISTNYAPVSNTRGNTTENNNELDSLYVSETVSTSTFSETNTLNLSINKYEGTVSEVVVTSPDNTTDVDVIISFPQGLYHQNNDGSRSSRSVKVQIMYKEGDGEYKPISEDTELYIRDFEGEKQPLNTSTTTVNGAEVTMQSCSDMNVADQLFYRPIGFTLPEPGKYTVRVRCAAFSEKTNYDIGVPYCAEIQFYVNGNVLDNSILPKVNQIAFEATAYKGLSGTIKKFNYLAAARIPIWNGTDWNTINESSNPAAIIRYLLTDSLANPRPISPDLIDNDSLVMLYNWCEQEGYKADGIVSEATKTMDVINEILKNCQGAMIPLLNGKHTFAIDGNEKTPKGMFNQHNSWDFTWSPTLGRQTEAIRASFTDSEDYTQDEVTVYWYDGAVHNEIKEGTTDADYLLVKKDLKYVTDRTSVIKAITYELLCTQTKRNNFEFSVNLEALNMTLLDRVYVSNSSNMQNESTGLIKRVLTDNGNITGFELYSDVEIPTDAKIIIRSLDYEAQEPVINIYDVINEGLTNIVEIDPITNTGVIKGAGEIQGLEDKWHYDGDLFTLGQDTIYDCVITDIKYNEDCTATITCRDY